MKALLIAATAVLLAAPALAASYNVAPSQGHQPIKAQVTDATPAHYTIDVKKVANLNVNQQAKTFAVYIGAKLPAECGDFTTTDIDYQKPDKYHRVFDLSQKPEILAALNEKSCVLIPNKPKLPPAKS